MSQEQPKAFRTKVAEALAKIVFAAMSALVCTVVVGAGVIVWKGATGVDDRVKQATEGLTKQADYLEKALDVIQAELKKEKDERIANEQKLNDAFAEHKKVELTIPTSVPGGAAGGINGVLLEEGSSPLPAPVYTAVPTIPPINPEDIKQQSVPHNFIQQQLPSIETLKERSKN